MSKPSAALSRLIPDFLDAGKRYFRAAQLERIDAPRSAVAHSAQRFKHRAALLKMTAGLVAALESAKHDSALLLRFRYAIDGGGGPAAAALIWPELEPMLRRLAIVPGRQPKDPATIKPEFRALAPQKPGRKRTLFPADVTAAAIAWLDTEHPYTRIEDFVKELKRDGKLSDRASLKSVKHCISLERQRRYDKPAAQ